MESFAELILSDKLVLVDFYADWCGPCRAMEPVIKDVVKSTKNKLRIVKVNIDKQPQIAQSYNVNAVPTFIAFKQGRILWRHPGMIDKKTLLSKIEQIA